MFTAREVLSFGFGTAFGVAMMWFVPRTAAPTTGTEPSARTAAPRVRSEGVSVGDESASRSALERQLAASERERQVLQQRLEGTPVRWSGDVPESLQPEGFETLAREAVRACLGDPPALGVDCDEPPCFLLVAMDGESEVLRERLIACPAWTAHFADDPLAWRLSRSCGGTERVVVAIAAKDSFEYVEAADGGAVKPKTRLGWRSGALKDEWLCPATSD